MKKKKRKYKGILHKHHNAHIKVTVNLGMEDNKIKTKMTGRKDTK